MDRNNIERCCEILNLQLLVNVFLDRGVGGRVPFCNNIRSATGRRLIRYRHIQCLALRSVRARHRILIHQRAQISHNRESDGVNAEDCDEKGSDRYFTEFDHVYSMKTANWNRRFLVQLLRHKQGNEIPSILRVRFGEYMQGWEEWLAICTNRNRGGSVGKMACVVHIDPDTLATRISKE